MFVIPNYKPNSNIPVTQLTFALPQTSFILQPKQYVVDQYPLTELNCYIEQLFNPFLKTNYNVNSIVNTTDSINLTPITSIASIAANTYFNRFTDYHMFLPSNKSVTINLSVYQTIKTSSFDIQAFSNYNLESINITGYNAPYTQAGTLVSLIGSYVYPLPICLNLSMSLVSSNSRSIYQMSSIPSYIPDTILYNNIQFARTTKEVPASKEFSYTTGGVLLWT